MIDHVENQWLVGETTTVSKYDYANDELGRRQSAVRTGTAFAQGHYDDWAYNDRNELAGSDHYLGANPNDLSQPVNDLDLAYEYDRVGNGKSSEAGSSTTAYTSNELNQYAMTNTEGLTYDEDGNLIEVYLPGDVDRDGDTDQSDLGVLLADWGCDDPIKSCDGDLNGDDKTDQADLGILLADWGCGT